MRAFFLYDSELSIINFSDLSESYKTFRILIIALIGTFFVMRSVVPRFLLLK